MQQTIINTFVTMMSTKTIANSHSVLVAACNMQCTCDDLFFMCTTIKKNKNLSLAVMVYFKTS